MTIKQNEARGREVELIVAKKMHGIVSPSRTWPYDVEIGDALLEVKCCKVKTKGYKMADGQYMQTGRFFILVNSHERLKQKAVEMAKEPKYVFVVYDLVKDRLEVVRMKTVSYETVSSLLSSRKVYTRTDGLKLVGIRHTEVFEDRTLVA